MKKLITATALFLALATASGAVPYNAADNAFSAYAVGPGLNNLSIKDDKASIAVFPEGRTNRTADPLLPYRCGVFKIAQKANVPIVICSLVNSRAILRNMFRKHTEVWLDVLDVIPAEELAGKTTIEVGERVHAVMEAGVVRREQAQGLR